MVLDATQVALPFNDVMAALEKNEVDCAENNMPSFESTGHYKVAKSVYVKNHVFSPGGLGRCRHNQVNDALQAPGAVDAIRSSPHPQTSA